MTRLFLGSLPPENGEISRLTLFSLHSSLIQYHMQSCRLQGFPEEYVLPFNDGAKNQRQMVAQFYRQIGNAVSPPCVAAVASFLLDTKERSAAEAAVFDLLVKASPKQAKVRAAIERVTRS